MIFDPRLSQVLLQAILSQYLETIIALWGQNHRTYRYYQASFFELYILYQVSQVSHLIDDVKNKAGLLNRYREDLKSLDQVKEDLINSYKANRTIILRQTGDLKPTEAIRIVKRRKQHDKNEVTSD